MFCRGCFHLLLITIGFALGDKTMPEARKPIPIFDGGIFAGVLNPIHNIRLVGMQCCSYCPGIGEFHTGECEQNKAHMQSFLKRKKKIAEAGGEAPSKSAKPTRRGTIAGLRRIERQNLKENTLEVAKPAPAQP